MSYTWPAARATLAAAFRAEGSLSAWEVYEEPPEQLAGGACLVIAPDSPYRSFQTLGEGATHLVLHLLVPRSSAPALDALDAGLASVQTVLMADEDVEIGDVVEVGMLDDVGGMQYIVTSLSVTYH